MIVSFLGLTCSGKGTITKKVHEKLLDKYRVAILSSSDVVKTIITDADREAMQSGGLFPREPELRDAIYAQVEGMFAFGAQMVLVDGFPRFDDQVRWMRQTFYEYPLQFIEVRARDDFELTRRAAARNRDEFDVGAKFMSRLTEQRSKLASATGMILQYALPLATVINDHLDRAVAETMGRLRLPEPEKSTKKKRG